MWKDYVSLKELKKDLVFKRIVEWSESELILEDGTKMEVVCSESDCCAWAEGEFNRRGAEDQERVRFPQAVQAYGHQHRAAAATIHDQPCFALRLSLAARPELSFIGRSTFDFRKRVLV